MTRKINGIGELILTLYYITFIDENIAEHGKTFTHFETLVPKFFFLSFQNCNVPEVKIKKLDLSLKNLGSKNFRLEFKSQYNYRV